MLRFIAKKRKAITVRDVAGEEVSQLLTAVDGSVVQTQSTIAEAAYLKDRNGHSKSAWRLHTHFDLAPGTRRSRRPSAAALAGTVNAARSAPHRT